MGGGSLFLGVLGFDERFLARCLLRVFSGRGLGRVVLFVPEPVDDVGRRRSGEALEYLEGLVRDYIGVELRVVRVGHGDFGGLFLGAWRELARGVSEGLEPVLCLSGGMRYGLLALVAAAVGLGAGGVAQVDLESGQGFVEVPLAPLRGLAGLSGRELAVLMFLWERPGSRLSDVASGLGLAKSTVYKVLGRLVEAGLVRVEGRRYYPVFPPRGLGVEG